MTDWAPLRQALAELRAQNIDLPFWWRDDDAIQATSKLDQLHALASDLDMPVYLAVIPAKAEASLVDYMQDRPLLHPMVHGWSHTNTAPAGQKKSEFGVPRDGALPDLARGLDRLKQMFGTTLVPMFVPPWNRISDDLVPHLSTCGYAAFSTFGARGSHDPLTQINTHVDPIFWRGHRSLVDPDILIAQTVSLLTARANGSQDSSEPLGYLTHHLVHDPEIWAFSHDFINVMLDGGAQPANIMEAIT